MANLLHDAVEPEKRKPVVVLDICETGIVLVEIWNKHDKSAQRSFLSFFLSLSLSLSLYCHYHHV